MKIKRIKFQNYTVFEDQQMEFSPGINVIIGENGTGKTHLMKALYSALDFISIVLYPDGLYQSVTVWNGKGNLVKPDSIYQKNLKDIYINSEYLELEQKFVSDQMKNCECAEKCPVQRMMREKMRI